MEAKVKKSCQSTCFNSGSISTENTRPNVHVKYKDQKAEDISKGKTKRVAEKDTSYFNLKNYSSLPFGIENN